MSVVINGVEYVLRITNKGHLGQTLGQFLRVLRKGMKLTLDEAALQIGCSKSYLWEIEHDGAEPGLKLAASIAAAYGVPIAALAACLSCEKESAA